MGIIDIPATRNSMSSTSLGESDKGTEETILIPYPLPLTPYPSSQSSVYSVCNFHIPVEMQPTHWNRTIENGCDIAVQSLPMVSPKVAVLSMPIAGRVRIDVRSFFFAPQKEPCLPSEKSLDISKAISPASVANSVGVQKTDQVLVEETPKQYTRICVPRDAIKLKDRLNFLLQPPLENILGQPTLEVPHEPFPYQLSGISFL